MVKLPFLLLFLGSLCLLSVRAEDAASPAAQHEKDLRGPGVAHEFTNPLNQEACQRAEQSLRDLAAKGTSSVLIDTETGEVVAAERK